MNDGKRMLDMGSDKRDYDAEDKHKAEKKNERMTEDHKIMNMLVKKMHEMQTEYDVTEHLVIDIGHATTKIGFSGEDLPTYVMPSIYGIDLEKKNELTFETKSHLYGYEALDAKMKEDPYSVKYLKPGDHKNLIDTEFCDFLKEILENRLAINSSDFKVIVNTSPIKNPENIGKLTKMLIDDLNFRAVAMVNSSSLSLFSTGRTSGLVVECGENRSYIVPVYEGFPIYHAMNKNRIGGRDLTRVLSDGIIENGLNVNPEDLSNLRQIKEKTLSVPYLHDIDHYLNSTEDIITPEKMLYKLPDDETIVSIPKKSRLLAAELLFK
jgi:actin